MNPMLSSRHRRAIRLASHFVAPYRWHAFGALLALIVTAGITLSMGQGIRLLVDQGFMTQSPHLLNQSIGLFMVLVVGLAVGTFARFYLVSWIGERVVADIRRQVFNHLVYLHPGFYEDNRSSEIQSRLTADTTLLQSVIGSSLSLFLRNLLMVIGGIVLLFITNPKLTSIVVIALPLVVAPILIFGRRVRSLSRESQDRIADVGSYVSETLGQIKTVQAYNHQVQDEQRFAVTVEEAFETARKRIVQRSSLFFRRAPVTPMLSPRTSSRFELSFRMILPSATRALSLSIRIFSARKVSRRWIRVTVLAILARYSASSTAVLPPPTTATGLLR